MCAKYSNPERCFSLPWIWRTYVYLNFYTDLYVHYLSSENMFSCSTSRDNEWPKTILSLQTLLNVSIATSFCNSCKLHMTEKDDFVRHA